MAKKYKEYEEDIFRGSTPGVDAPLDVEFTGTTEGGIPETESMLLVGRYASQRNGRLA